ncbi:hypothetical protein Q5O14_11325 [Eubacteriaceae bacterium ES2]|nr:hypothetical protein Q5O14_11325 [Eubacteriaceae bacterium ES2]
MYQDLFLPVVFELNLGSDQAWFTSEWKLLIHEILQRYINLLIEKENCMIGHVKALAMISEHDYIKFSCSNDAGQIDTQHQGKSKKVSSVNVIINSLVANICETDSYQMLKLVCQTFEKSETIDIRVEIKKNLSQRHEHHHDGSDCPICNGHHR